MKKNFLIGILFLGLVLGICGCREKESNSNEDYEIENDYSEVQEDGYQEISFSKYIKNGRSIWYRAENIKVEEGVVKNSKISKIWVIENNECSEYVLNLSNFSYSALEEDEVLKINELKDFFRLGSLSKMQDNDIVDFLESHQDSDCIEKKTGNLFFEQFTDGTGNAVESWEIVAYNHEHEVVFNIYPIKAWPYSSETGNYPIYNSFYNITGCFEESFDMGDVFFTRVENAEQRIVFDELGAEGYLVDPTTQEIEEYIKKQ